MSFTLYAPLGNPRSDKIEIVAEHLKVDLQFNRLDYSELKTKEYLAKHPLGKVPLLDTPEGPIYESNSIIRYLARKQNALYGLNVFEVSQVDQWLDFHNAEIDPLTFTLMAMIAGWQPANKDLYTEAKKGLKEAVKVLEGALKGKKFLVGDAVSIADIAIASVLSIPFRLLFDEKTRSTIPSVTAWFLNVTSLPAFQSVHGKAWLCEKEYEVHFGEEPKHAEVKKEEKKEEKKEAKKPEEAKKKDEGKKEAKKEKKETKKEEPKKKKKEEEEEEEEDDTSHLPKKKTNPLDVLPPTPFKLDDFKREISNAPDRSVVLKDFWTKYDAAGWSLWKVVYQKYEGEGVVDYLTSNLMNGFIRNLDHFRKYAFAGYGVYGTPGHFDIKGVWMWRGTEIPEEWKEHQSFEYHNFEKLDHTNEAHRKLVEEYWINTKETDTVEGQPIYEAKHFK